MLATASLGAVWSSCSPDFGVKGVLDRFGQIEPKVLFCADGYRYAGKEIDSLVARAGDREGDAVDPASCRCSVSAERPEISVIRSEAVRDWTGRDLRPRRGIRPESRVPSLERLAVRSSAVHHVLVRHHRSAEVHGAWRRGDAVAAPQGARAAHRSAARGPHLLLHDLWVDDVELAGELARGGSDSRALRRRAVRTARDSLWTWRRRNESPSSGRARSISRWPKSSASSPPGTTWARCARSCPPAARLPRRASTTCTNR